MPVAKQEHDFYRTAVIKYTTHILLNDIRSGRFSGLDEVVRTNISFMFVFYVIVFMAGIICIRPSTTLFFWNRVPDLKSYSILRLLFIGLIGGAIASVLASALPISGMHKGIGTAGDQIAQIINYNHSAMLMIPITILLIIFVAVITELFFRGIVFRSLAEYSTMPAATVVSCLLCSLVWPIYNPTAGIVLGVVSSILFYRTGKILPSVVANAAFTLTGPACSVLLHRLL